MKKLKLTVVMCVTLAVSGCAGMVDYATEVFKEIQDTTKYETVRDSVDEICDDANYGMMVNRYGKTLVDKLRRDVCNPDTRKIDPGL